jgi:hypothetical protein
MMRMRSCAFVSFSLLLLLFCACKKNKKILIKNAVALDFNDRTRNKFLPDRDKRVKKEERFSHEREKERKEERREPFVALRDKKNWYIELSSSSSSS